MLGKLRDAFEMCFFLTRVPKLNKVRNKVTHGFLGDCYYWGDSQANYAANLADFIHSLKWIYTIFA